jgi:hypothetical protein
MKTIAATDLTARTYPYREPEITILLRGPAHTAGLIKGEGFYLYSDTKLDWNPPVHSRWIASAHHACHTANSAAYVVEITAPASRKKEKVENVTLDEDYSMSGLRPTGGFRDTKWVEIPCRLIAIHGEEKNIHGRFEHAWRSFIQG